MARHSPSYDVKSDSQQKLSKPASACWMLLPLLGLLVALQAIKFLAIFICLLPFPLILALILMHKKPETTAGQAAKSFLTGFLLLFGLYLFIAGVAWLWEVFF